MVSFLAVGVVAIKRKLYNRSSATVVATTSDSVTSNSYIVVALQYVGVPSVAIMSYRSSKGVVATTFDIVTSNSYI